MSQRVFGYGSLVNSSTHPRNAQSTGPVILSGWRRLWAHHLETASGTMCVLTIEPSAGAAVVGVLLDCDQAAMRELDLREQGYERRAVEVAYSESPSQRMACITYVSMAARGQPASREAPIWRSYLDCVLAGFLALGGVPALEEFIRTTGGWDGPILDDRVAPLYSRAVRLSALEAGEIDEALARHRLLAHLARDSGA